MGNSKSTSRCQESSGSGWISRSSLQSSAIAKQTSNFFTPSKKKTLAPSTPDVNSELECPICFVNFAELNHTKCCKQMICTGCYNEVHSNSPDKKLKCPFCGDSINYEVVYDPTGLSTAVEPVQTQNVDVSTPPSPSRKPVKDIFIPLATTADRKELEELIMKTNKTLESQGSTFNNQSSPQRSNSGRRTQPRAGRSLNPDNPRSRISANDAGSSLYAAESSPTSYRTIRSSGRYQTIDSLNNSPITPLNGSGSSSNSRIDRHNLTLFDGIDVNNIQSLEDLENIMLQEAMKLSLQETLPIESSMTSNTSLASNTKLSTDSQSNSVETSSIIVDKSPDEAEDAQLNLDDINFNQVEYNMEMSEEDQLNYALALSLKQSVSTGDLENLSSPETAEPMVSSSVNHGTSSSEVTASMESSSSAGANATPEIGILTNSHPEEVMVNSDRIRIIISPDQQDSALLSSDSSQSDESLLNLNYELSSATEESSPGVSLADSFESQKSH